LQAFDRIDYASSPFLGGSRKKHMALMAYQAKRLAESSLSDLANAARQWPEIILGLESQLAFERSAWLEMLMRYGQEWRHLLDGNSDLQSALGWDPGA
jgi:hypothetical protein